MEIDPKQLAGNKRRSDTEVFHRIEALPPSPQGEEGDLSLGGEQESTDTQRGHVINLVDPTPIPMRIFGSAELPDVIPTMVATNNPSAGGIDRSEGQHLQGVNWHPISIPGSPKRHIYNHSILSAIQMQLGVVPTIGLGDPTPVFSSPGNPYVEIPESPIELSPGPSSMRNLRGKSPVSKVTTNLRTGVGIMKKGSKSRAGVNNFRVLDLNHLSNEN